MSKEQTFVPKEILQSIALVNPSRETAMLNRVTDSSLSVDDAIKRLEPNASTSYIANKLVSLEGKKRVFGLKKLIDKYIEASLVYDQFAAEIDEILSLVVGPDAKIEIRKFDDYFEILIWTDGSQVDEQMIRNVFQKYRFNISTELQPNGQLYAEIFSNFLLDDLDSIARPLIEALQKYVKFNNL